MLFKILVPLLYRLGTLLSVIGGDVFRQWFGGKETGSVLMSVFGRRVNLVPLSAVPIAGYETYLFTTTAIDTAVPEQNVGAKPGSVIIKVILPFVSTVQIVGFSQTYEPLAAEIRKAACSHDLEEVVLEGDFPNYFNLYATKNSQSATRERLDPQAMAFIVDFCQSHTWEINGKELCFAMSAEARQDESDPTAMASDIREFIRVVRPVVTQDPAITNG